MPELSLRLAISALYHDSGPKGQKHTTCARQSRGSRSCAHCAPGGRGMDHCVTADADFLLAASACVLTHAPTLPPQGGQVLLGQPVHPHEVDVGVLLPLERLCADVAGAVHVQLHVGVELRQRKMNERLNAGNVGFSKKK